MGAGALGDGVLEGADLRGVQHRLDERAEGRGVLAELVELLEDLLGDERREAAGVAP